MPRQDGFGTSLIVSAAGLGRVERRVLTPALSTPGSEQAIRARAARLIRLARGPIGRVLRVERKGSLLWTLGDILDGVTLSDALAAIEFGTLALSDAEVLQLTATVVRAAGRMHESLGGLAHGALCPTHVVLMRDGSVIFTGAVFGDALQALKLDRVQLWRQFGIAMPMTVGTPRFDHHGDIAQLAAIVLAIAHRRALTREEFPDRFDGLVKRVVLTPVPRINARIQTWLQDALQLQGRAAFDSLTDAVGKFGRILPDSGYDEATALALRAAILQL